MKCYFSWVCVCVSGRPLYLWGWSNRKPCFAFISLFIRKHRSCFIYSCPCWCNCCWWMGWPCHIHRGSAANQNAANRICQVNHTPCSLLSCLTACTKLNKTSAVRVNGVNSLLLNQLHSLDVSSCHPELTCDYLKRRAKLRAFFLNHKTHPETPTSGPQFEGLLMYAKRIHKIIKLLVFKAF